MADQTNHVARPRPPRSPTTLLALLALAAAIPAQAQTTLRWKFTQGEKHHYILTQVHDVFAKAAGDLDLHSTTTFTVDTTWAIREVSADGSARMTQTINRIQVSSKDKDEELKFDSRRPNAIDKEFAPVKKNCQVMIGKPIELTMSPLGFVKDVKIPPEAKRRPADTPYASNLTITTFRDFVDQAAPSFPVRAVGVGDAWDGLVHEHTSDGQTTIALMYTFRGPADDLQRIDADLKTRIDESELNLSITSEKSSASYFFDNELGLLRRSEVLQELTFVSHAEIRVVESLKTITKTTLKLIDDAAKE